MTWTSPWFKERVLILVKTYPTPAWRGVEVSCTAAMTSSGEWMRLFPVPFRFLEFDKRFKKYQWTNLRVKKASDSRPESHKIDIDSISTDGDPLPTADSWRARRDAIEHLRSHCLCCIKEKQERDGFPTLGFFRPHEITAFSIEDDVTTWTDEQLARLRRVSLFQPLPAEELRKIPYKFRYHFRCDHESCKGHGLTCTDWELGQAYRSWFKQYG